MEIKTEQQVLNVLSTFQDKNVLVDLILRAIGGENLVNYLQFNSMPLIQYISEHIENKDNPHKVTKEQLGLGNLPDTEQLIQTIHVAHSHPNIESLSRISSEDVDKLKELDNEDIINTKQLNAERFTFWDSRNRTWVVDNDSAVYTITNHRIGDVAVSLESYKVYIRLSDRWYAVMTLDPDLFRVSYNDLQDIPTEFTPAPHTHDFETDITNVNLSGNNIYLYENFI